MASNSIKIIETCKIIPNDPVSKFSMPLTFLDMLWLRLDPVSRLFFYEFPKQNTDFWNTFLPQLEKSLSFTLQHYVPVAGRITWPHDSKSPLVQCSTDDGVSLTVAETQSDFNSLSGYEFRGTSELLALLPNFPTNETQAPVMTLQITLFPDTGFSIGYVVHHGVMDGKSLSMFMHSWAYICKNGDGYVLPPELTPSFNRSFVDHQKSELESNYLEKFGGKPIEFNNKSLPVLGTTLPPDVLLGTFKLSRENINALKNSLSNSFTPISTFTASTAYAFVCLVKAKRIASEKAFIGINADARGRLEPPLSSTYFGNCVIGCGDGVDVNDLITENGFAVTVKLVSGIIDLMNEGVVKLTEDLKGRISSILELYTKRKVSLILVAAGSPRFELYKADFGWGRPIKVDMISIAKSGAFYLSDSRDGNGGIEIGVALNQHEAEAFKSVFVGGLESC